MPHKVLSKLRKQLRDIETEVEGLLCSPNPKGNPRYMGRMFKALRARVDEVTDLFPVSAAQADTSPKYRTQLDDAADEFDADLDDLDASCTTSSESSVSLSSVSSVSLSSVSSVSLSSVSDVSLSSVSDVSTASSSST